MNDQFFFDLERLKKDTFQFEAYSALQNTVVIAGPGSGKTRVLSIKAVSLAKSYIHKPSGLACISYSRESVRELKKRLKEYGFKPSNKDFIGTVHSFSLLHVIQPFAHLYPQYGVKYPIKIIPDKISNEIYQGVLSDLNSKSESVQFGEINKHRCLSLKGISSIYIPSSNLVSTAADLYEERLLKTEYLDFTSIINISAQIIQEQSFVRDTLKSRFPWLLIDEYQDLGKALHEMVLELVFNADIKLFAVGDTNQSIYGFNGGYPDFLEELTHNEDIKTIKLASNYRSNQHIIEASLGTLIPSPPVPQYFAQGRNNEAADFTFITCVEEMEQQYRVVAEKIIPRLVKNGVSLNEIGVITDSNGEVKSLARILKLNTIPFFIAKWDFQNSNVVVWLQDCACWCLSEGDQSFEELFLFWKRLLINHEDPRKNYEHSRLKTIFHKILLKSSFISSLEEWMKCVYAELELEKTLIGSKLFPDEIKNLSLLLEEATHRNLKDSHLKRFAQLGFPNNEVTLTTRHSAKGLEFEAIIMLGMEEERFPHYKHKGNQLLLAEDQRLCYVCVSRAKKTCILLRSEKHTIHTRNGPWLKNFSSSRFWNILLKKFGTASNVFTNRTY